MLKKTFLILLVLCGAIGLGVRPSAAQISLDLSQGGPMRLGTSTDVCNASMLGGLHFNDYSREILYCDGIKWRRLVFGSTSTVTAAPSVGYFVLTQTTWNGDMSGMSNVDELCLTELTTNTNWRGYADAQARGLLVASKVRAFICGYDSCINPIPLTSYAFARVGSATDGGATFTTDEQGFGPYNSDNWSGAAYFGVNATYWSGRADNGGALSYWNDNPGNGGGGCTQYTSTGGFAGVGTSNSTGIARWRIATGSRPACSNSYPLVCLVNP